jgi:hypothetical protein
MATESLSTFPHATLPPALGANLLYFAQGGVDVNITPNELGLYNGGVLTGTPANPTGTTATGAAVMMGLAQLFTPGFSTRIKVEVSFMMANSTVNDGATAQLRFGTGSAPANGAALTGTAVGSGKSFSSLTAALKTCVTLTAIITGLTLAAQYWLDVSLIALIGGTATITDVTLTAHEV